MCDLDRARALNYVPFNIECKHKFWGHQIFVVLKHFDKNISSFIFMQFSAEVLRKKIKK